MHFPLNPFTRFRRTCRGAGGNHHISEHKHAVQQFKARTAHFAEVPPLTSRKIIHAVFVGLLAVSLAACEGSSSEAVSSNAGSSSGNTSGGDTSGGDTSGGDTSGGDTGGGGIINPPEAPDLSLATNTTKTFSFSWEDVSAETEYRLLVNPDGSSGFTQIATLAADTTEHDIAVLLPARINASYILQACNSGGCTDSNTVNVTSSLTEQIGYLKASNTGANDLFGLTIALSGDGNTLAVGAPYEDSNTTTINGAQDNNDATNSGAVYVFYRDGLTWAQQAYIKASNADTNDKFGSSLAFSSDGSTLAVGAVGEDTTVANSGAAYIYTRVGTTWSEQAKIKAFNPGGTDQFGHAIALAGDGNTLAVGAWGEDGDDVGIDGDNNNNATDSGAVYLFTRTGTVWSSEAYVKASNTGASDQFGSSIALSDDGTTLAVGAWSENGGAVGINGLEDDDSANDSGAVYLFTNEGGNWSQQAYIKASNTEVDDAFGSAVALSADGNTLAVGAPGEDNEFGTDGSTNNNSVEDSGAVYLFTRSGFTWSQQAYLKASNAKSGDEFGYSLALSNDGNTLAVAAKNESSSATGINGDQTDTSAPNSGAAYLFGRNNGQWLQLGYIKAPNAEEDDEFGTSIALDGSGSTLAVAAPNEASNASGINGDQTNSSASYSGAVYLY